MGRFQRGYRVGIDLRPLLRELESGKRDSYIWKELWNELHHQGDVELGSYASVPHLVRIHKERGGLGWNTYGLVSTIAVEAGRGRNPEIPNEWKQSFDTAIGELAALGGKELFQMEEDWEKACVLGLLALSVGLNVEGRLLTSYSTDELADMITLYEKSE